MNCEKGWVLSYSIHELSLENQATCSAGEEPTCVDWVNIESDSNGYTKPLCGTQNLDNAFFLDGQSVNIEFVSNRNEQEAGFLLFATCSEPGFTVPRPGESMKRAASEECTFPSDTGWIQSAQMSSRQALVSISFPADHSLVTYKHVH